MATRARKSKAVQQSTNSLLVALKFCNLIPHEHCAIYGMHAVATDNILTAAHPIADDITICPQTARLIAGLERCNNKIAITIDETNISIKSGPFRVTVQCVDMASNPASSVYPDSNVAPLDDRFLEALKIVSVLAVENSTEIVGSAICCMGQTVAACSPGRNVLMETWHGIDLPPYWILPKRSAAFLLSVGKKLTGFGYSGKSATFWFEDSSWFKTQLYEDKFPDISAIWKPANQLVNTPEKLFEVVDKLIPLTEKASFAEGKLIGENVECEVPDLKSGTTFYLKQLKQVKGVFERYDDKTSDRATFFFGKNTRGAIAKIRGAQDEPR